MSLPTPVDIAGLVARTLRSLIGADVPVSTETGRGVDGGPPSLPWLLIREDAHTWSWPAVQRATVRLTAWHDSEYAAKALVGQGLALLCDRGRPAGLLAAEPVSAPIGGVDPYTSAPLATAAVSVLVRTPV